MPTPNPLNAVLDNQGILILDAGLATALEAKGFDLNDSLWSARLLIEAPEAIRQVHIDFLEAGADCICTASYQASIEGFRGRGLDEDQASELLSLSVQLATEARDAFWDQPGNRVNRLRPLVAASVGPYGAFLADGSEYTGDYGLSEEDLYEFHRDRWHILAESGADLLACETLPSSREALVLLRLLEETKQIWAWLSFSCRDEAHLNDGTAIEDVARRCAHSNRVAAVGINCTPPALISELLARLRRTTTLPILVYPNSGEHYDPAARNWKEGAVDFDWGNAACEWSRAGAGGIGGCCRVTATDISLIRSRLIQ